MYFKTETAAAQSLIGVFFLTLNVRWPSYRKDLKWKKCRGTGLISEKKGSFVAEFNEKGSSHP